MKIKDPRNFSWEKNSPYAIYAAGSWFGSRSDPDWQDQSKRWAETNSCVYRGELSNSEISILDLVKELFFLHLTIRSKTDNIIQAISYLKSRKDSQVQINREILDIPFMPEDDPFFINHSWLFYSAVFGQAGSSAWLKSANEAGSRIQSNIKNTESSSIYNFLRGTIIIPDAARINGVIDAIKALAMRQEPSGFFKDIAPWQIYNLIAHSNHPEALKILDKLEAPLLKLQNRDSSWGEERQKPLAAFLMAHGLQNRGYFN